MTDTPIEPTYQAEPVVAVEYECVNEIYKIKYIECYVMMDEDDDPHIATKKKTKFYEVTEQPIPAYSTCETEWDEQTVPSHNINQHTCCCSKSFVEYVEKQIKNNKTDFPTTIFVNANNWIILEVTKIK